MIALRKRSRMNDFIIIIHGAQQMENEKEYAVAVQNNSLPDLAEVASRLYSISRESRKTYMFAMNAFKKFCEKKKKSPNVDLLVEWIETCATPSTRIVYVAALKKVLKEVFMHDPRYYQIENVLNSIKRPKPDRSITDSKYLTKKEFMEVVKFMKPHIKLISEVMFWTGLRVSPCLNIELVNCTVNGNICEIKTIGKRNKESVVFITTKLYDKCRKYFGGKVYLFEHKGKRFSREFISRQIMKASGSFGKRISAHGLRHSKAMFLKDEMHLSIEEIQRVLSHSNISTTSIYLHSKPTAKQQGIV